MERAAASASSRSEIEETQTKLRAQGLRPIEIWVPDVRSEAFKTAAREQSKAVATSAHAEDDQSFVDEISDWPDA